MHPRRTPTDREAEKEARRAAPPNPTLALARAMLAAQEKAERKAKKPEPVPELAKKKPTPARAAAGKPKRGAATR